MSLNRFTRNGSMIKPRKKSVFSYNDERNQIFSRTGRVKENILDLMNRHLFVDFQKLHCTDNIEDMYAYICKNDINLCFLKCKYMVHKRGWRGHCKCTYKHPYKYYKDLRPSTVLTEKEEKLAVETEDLLQ